MKISLKDQAKISPALPMRCAATFTGSALPLEFADIPGEIGGAAVVAVAATVTNADGAAATAPCEHADGVWRVAFAASCFEHYGFVERGVSVALTLRDGSGNERGMVLAVGDLEVKRSSPSAAPGDPEKSYQIKGEDIFVKTRVIDGVQHYARQEMSYDAEMRAWGADWLGDYILVDGEFVPFQAAGGTAATVATALLALLLVPFSAFGITATKEYVDRKDGEIAALATNIVKTATNALAQAITTNSAAIKTINSKIPSAASASNQLADKEWIDDEIDTYAAYYITYTAAGAAFPTRAALLNATVVYSGGAARTPTRNDYAVVLADETHSGAEWRYLYTVAAGATSGQWDAQYPIETNDYDGLSNKPQINGVSLSGNKTGADLGVLDLSGGTVTGQISTPQVNISRTGYPTWSMALDGDAGALHFTAPPLVGVFGAVDVLLPRRSGNLSGTLALASDISAAISPTSPAFSNAVLSVGLGIDTNTVAVINELVGSAHDLPVTGATSVGALLLALAAAVAALKKNLRYAYNTATVSSGTTPTVTDVADGAINSATLGSSVTAATVTLPAATTGRARDFFIDLTIEATTAPTLTFIDPATNTTANVTFGADSLADIDTGKNAVLFTEFPNYTWLVSVKHEEVST